MEKTPQKSESRDQDKFIVRFPDGMRDLIAEAAKSNNRSMNAEIVSRIEASFANEGSITRSLTIHSVPDAEGGKWVTEPTIKELTRTLSDEITKEVSSKLSQQLTKMLMTAGSNKSLISAFTDIADDLDAEIEKPLTSTPHSKKTK